MRVALPLLVAVLATSGLVTPASAQAPASGASSSPFSDNPFLGGVPSGTASAEPIRLTVGEAIGRALDDLPGHARRFARWRARSIAAAARMKQSGNAGRFVRLWPLRPGRPPGARKRPTHEIHEVLADLQYFAFHALEGRTDSS